MSHLKSNQNYTTLIDSVWFQMKRSYVITIEIQFGHTRHGICLACLMSSLAELQLFVDLAAESRTLSVPDFVIRPIKLPPLEPSV